MRRVRDGVCEPIPPSEFLAWRTAKAEIVYPHEYDILMAMDAAYCEGMNEELENYRKRQAEASSNSAPPLPRLRRRR